MDVKAFVTGTAVHQALAGAWWRPAVGGRGARALIRREISAPAGTIHRPASSQSTSVLPFLRVNGGAGRAATRREGKSVDHSLGLSTKEREAIPYEN
ncbi:MAG TPA: hypothetical protein VFT47_00230 [Vicinamibacterales bacterium]|nr:hypothetical protein [Vicinamibacterales bacterium]